MIKGRRYSEIPGDTRMVMTSSVVDAWGRTWPRGTVYQPLSGGEGGQTITIRGERVEVQS